MIAVYSDEGESASSADRPEWNRLRADAARMSFGTVIVDDLSRASRGKRQREVDQLEELGLKLADVESGLSSDDEAADMVFAVKGMISHQYVKMIARQTHRGLEGRALAGYATGGRTFGFRAVPEANPPDPEHPRKVRVIVPAEQKVVVRVFEMFRDGVALKKIAATLNNENIAAPHDNGRGNKRAPGWAHTTIRAMLKNEQYVGVWRWNRDRWERIGDTKRYRRIPRPTSKQVVHHNHELAIVDSELWAAVQAKFARSPKGRGALSANVSETARPLKFTEQGERGSHP